MAESFTDKDVEHVASALFDIDRDIEPGTRGAYQRRAQAALRVLAETGRLLPEGQKFAEEYAVRDAAGAVWQVFDFPEDAVQYKFGPGERLVTRLVGPWVEVPTDTEGQWP